MLIEFRVSNFRSLRDEQVFSLIASQDRTQLDTHSQATGLKAAPNVLRSAVIFGANASGKSNLVKALQYMRGVVIESAALAPSQRFERLRSFGFDPEARHEPTCFEATFLLKGVRHRYGFAMTGDRIVSEYLFVYKAFKPQRWFERRIDSDTGKDVYEFGSGLKGQKHLWEGATRSNALFLSMSAQLNSDALRPVHAWFAKHLVIFNEVEPLSPHFTVEMLKNDVDRAAIVDFLRGADPGIKDVRLVSRSAMVHSIRFDLASGKREETASEQPVDEIKFHHATPAGDAVFDLVDESSGTRNLLFAAGPLLQILKEGRTLVIDELDSSLHTLLVQEIVRLFHRSDLNVAGAQLIFTTHDTALLDAFGLLRRDQIWFVEKLNDQSSRLYSLLEFSPRKNEALERGYLQGRYGALPYINMLGSGSGH
jgi:AAA15 family ATPase/GTPase